MEIQQEFSEKPGKSKGKRLIFRWLYIIVSVLCLTAFIWLWVVQGLISTITIFSAFATIASVIPVVQSLRAKDEEAETIIHRHYITHSLPPEVFNQIQPLQGTRPLPDVQPSEPSQLLSLPQRRTPRIDLGEALPIDRYYGREEQLKKLQGHVAKNGSRVLVITGSGGVGKTTLARKFVESEKDAFEFVIWCSLLNPLPLSELIQYCLYKLLQGQQVVLPKETDQQIDLLLEYLDEKSCCLILDNAESILLSNTHHAEYLPEFVDYKKLFQEMSRTQSKGCLLITSRELLPGIVNSSYILPLSGLEFSEAPQFLENKGIQADQALLKKLFDFYDGNPLALALGTDYAREFMGGDIEKFLSVHHGIDGSISKTLHEQFCRLSPLELQVMYLLAASRESQALTQLQKSLFYHSDQHKEIHELEGAINSLKRRSLIASAGGKFGLQPVILEYTVNCMLEQLVGEIKG